MNISSEIFPTDGSNGSFNSTMSNVAEIILAMNIITIALSFPANVYVIYLTVRGSGNGLAAELFTLNLSICEILLSLNNLLYVFFDSTLILVAFFCGQGPPMTGHSLFQSLICVERYLAVVHPVTFLKFKPLRYRVICSVIVWTTLVSSCWVVALFFHFELLDLLFYFTVAQLILFLSIQLFCCLAVLRALKQSGPGERTREKEENHVKKKAFQLILITTLSTVIIYAPIIISDLVLLGSVRNAEMLLFTSGYSSSLGGLVQPFLFLHRVGKLPFTMCQIL